jgi:hypothetical protein
VLLLFLLAVWLILLFGFVVFFGAPYLPTLSKQKQAALELLDLEPEQTLIELGSGDGRVLKAAAEKGLKVIGYELNPLLVVISYIRTFKYRKYVQIRWANYWWHTWPRTDAIFVFLLDRYMEKLDKKIIQSYPGKKIKLVSVAFKIPEREILDERDGVYLYEYKIPPKKTTEPAGT